MLLASGVSGSNKLLKSAVVNPTETGTLISGVANRRIKVFAYKLVVSANITVNFRDGAATALEGPQDFAAKGGVVEFVTPPEYLFGTTAGNSLDLVVVGTGTVAGRVSYWNSDQD